jgi:predicted cupin superfamily sugar epimerase
VHDPSQSWHGRILQCATLTVEALRAILGLTPHPVEGGYFTETYRSPDQIPAAALPSRYGDARPASTAIYYLLTPDTFSAMHRLASEESSTSTSATPSKCSTSTPTAPARSS